MKKLLSLLLVAMVLLLSGCGENTPLDDAGDYTNCRLGEVNDFVERNISCENSIGQTYLMTWAYYQELLNEDESPNTYYTKEEVDEMFNQANDNWSLLLERIDALEEKETYTKEEIYIIIEMHTVELKIHNIEQLAIDESRELTDEELLAISLYEMLLVQYEEELDAETD